MPMIHHRWSNRYAGSALLIALAAGTGLAAFLPVGRLTHFPSLTTRLGLPPVSVPAFGIPWTDLAVSPTAVHRAALATFFATLLWITAGVLVVAALTVIAIGVVRASARATEMSIH